MHKLDKWPGQTLSLSLSLCTVINLIVWPCASQPVICVLAQTDKQAKDPSVKVGQVPTPMPVWDGLFDWNAV